VNRSSILLLCVQACLFAAVATAETVVVPASFENVCATGTASAQPFPFASAPTFNGPYRYQQVYDASAFPTPPDPEQVLLISEIRFRVDEFTGGLEPITYTDITVNLSTTDKDVTTLATGSTDALDSNVGPDQTTVHTGQFTWDACGTPDTCTPHVCSPDLTPAPFDQALVFSKPFPYDPNIGNLLLEVYDLDQTPQTQLFDAAQYPDDFMPVTRRVREVINPQDDSHLWPTTFPNVGLVTQFVYTVPEAGASLASLAALLALAAVRRTRD